MRTSRSVHDPPRGRRSWNKLDIDSLKSIDTLTIKGESRSESEVHEEQYHRRERRFGGFYRQLTLPEAVKGDAAEANFENGVLRLHVPKADEARERRIPVRTAPEL